ncbi:hypothetical protein [Paraburkholderia sp. SIMBA_030]
MAEFAVPARVAHAVSSVAANVQNDSATKADVAIWRKIIVFLLIDL